MAFPSLARFVADFFSRRDGFTAEERLVREKFDFYLNRNFRKFRSIYLLRFQNVLNTDQAKELCEEYSANENEKIRFSRCVYAPAKAFITKLFRIEIAKKRVSAVMFLAGGAGSGKSTAVEGWKLDGNFPPDLLVVDGTLSDFNEAKSQIDLALSHKKSVIVIYVFCPVEKAVKLALDRAIKRGRGLPIPRLAQTHYDSQRTIFRLSADYHLNANVQFHVVDNTGVRPAASDMLSIVSQKYESLDAVTASAQSALHHEQHTREESGSPLPRNIQELFGQNG